jgi:hypothetical protein
MPKAYANPYCTIGSYNFIVVFFAALGSFTYGFSSSIIGAVFGLQEFFNYFNIDLATKEGNDIIAGAIMVSTRRHTLVLTFDSQRPMARSPAEE